MPEHFTVSQERACLHVTIERPGTGNAITDAMLVDLAELVADSGRDPGINALVLRGAGDEAAPSLWFHVDRRSSKISNVRRRPSVGLLCYDAVERVQIRVRGAALVHTDDPVADDHWAQVEISADYIASIMRSDHPPEEKRRRLLSKLFAESAPGSDFSWNRCAAFFAGADVV